MRKYSGSCPVWLLTFNYLGIVPIIQTRRVTSRRLSPPLGTSSLVDGHSHPILARLDTNLIFVTTSKYHSNISVGFIWIPNLSDGIYEWSLCPKVMTCILFLFQVYPISRPPKVVVIDKPLEREFNCSDLTSMMKELFKSQKYVTDKKSMSQTIQNKPGPGINFMKPKC